MCQVGLCDSEEDTSPWLCARCDRPSMSQDRAYCWRCYGEYQGAKIAYLQRNDP